MAEDSSVSRFRHAQWEMVYAAVEARDHVEMKRLCHDALDDPFLPPLFRASFNLILCGEDDENPYYRLDEATAAIHYMDRLVAAAGVTDDRITNLKARVATLREMIVDPDDEDNPETEQAEVAAEGTQAEVPVQVTVTAQEVANPDIETAQQVVDPVTKTVQEVPDPVETAQKASEEEVEETSSSVNTPAPRPRRPEQQRRGSSGTGSPEKRQISPVKRQISPVKRQVSPEKSQVSPEKRAVSPEKRQAEAEPGDDDGEQRQAKREKQT